MKFERDAVFTQRYIYSGRAAADAAEQMASEGHSGLVIDVRYPYLHVLRSISWNWHTISVIVDGVGSRTFSPDQGRAGLPWQVETDRDQVDIRVWNAVEESMRTTIGLQAGRVQIVVVHPRLTRLSIGPKRGIVTEGSRVVR